jgi:hypothetical protein
VRVLLSIDPIASNMMQGRCYGQCLRDDNDYTVAWIRQYKQSSGIPGSSRCSWRVCSMRSATCRPMRLRAHAIPSRYTSFTAAGWDA